MIDISAQRELNPFKRRLASSCMQKLSQPQPQFFPVLS